MRLENGLPAKAAIFGAKLVQAFLRGLALQSDVSFFGEDDEDPDLEEELDRAVESGCALPPTPAAGRSCLSAEQVKKVNQVHVNLGHISKEQMLSLFKAAGAKDSVMEFVKNEYSCPQCMRQKKPIERKRATMPRTFSFNRHVGIDLFYISWRGATHSFVNMIYHGTNYQQITWIRDSGNGTPASKLVWRAFFHTWIKPYGVPEVMISDGVPNSRMTLRGP